MTNYVIASGSLMFADIREVSDWHKRYFRCPACDAPSAATRLLCIHCDKDWAAFSSSHELYSIVNYINHKRKGRPVAGLGALVDSPWIAETELEMSEAEIAQYLEPMGVCQRRVCYCYSVGEDAGLACHD